MEEEDVVAYQNMQPLSIEDLCLICPRQINAAGTSPPNQLPESSNKYFSVVMGISQQRRERRRSKINVCKRRWQQAVFKARTMSDPWEKFHLDEYPTERAMRRRYNTFTKEWITDDVLVKMEPKVGW